MQMRQWLYEPVNKRTRAAEYRRAGMECQAAGYEVMAAVNFEMAEALSPTPRKQLDAPRVKERRGKGPDHTRVDGRRDAAPRKVVQQNATGTGGVSTGNQRRRRIVTAA